MKQLFYSITCNEPKRLVKPVIWNALANLANLLPFLCLAYIISRIYDYFVTGELSHDSLWISWGCMAVCFIITWLLENIACRLTYRDGFFASADGRVKLAEHIRKLPLGFLMSRDTGELGNTMMNDFSRTETAMTHILPQVISGGLVALIASAAMFAADWRMGLAMFAGFPISLLIMLGMRGMERNLESRLSKARMHKVLEQPFAEADSRNIPCVLDTDTPLKVKKYIRCGMGLCGEKKIKQGISLYTMAYNMMLYHFS